MDSLPSLAATLARLLTFFLLVGLVASGCGNDDGATCRGMCCRLPSADFYCQAATLSGTKTAWTCQNANSQSNVNGIIRQNCIWYSHPDWAGFCCSVI